MSKSEVKMAMIFLGISIVLAIVAVFAKSVTVKWIFGILSAGVLLFNLYAAFESMVKNKKSKKQSKDYLEGMAELSRRRDRLFQGQRPNDTNFGYSETNPIMTSTIDSSDRYLSRLRTINGDSFTWERLGSFCVTHCSGVENIMVDQYQLFVNNQKHKIIYLCPYGHNSQNVPSGLQFAEKA